VLACGRATIAATAKDLRAIRCKHPHVSEPSLETKKKDVGWVALNDDQIVNGRLAAHYGLNSENRTMSVLCQQRTHASQQINISIR